MWEAPGFETVEQNQIIGSHTKYINSNNLILNAQMGSIEIAMQGHAWYYHAPSWRRQVQLLSSIQLHTSSLSATIKSGLEFKGIGRPKSFVQNTPHKLYHAKKVIWHLNSSNAVPDTTHIREAEIHLHESWEVVQVWCCFLNIGGKPGSYMRLYSINP